MVSNKLNKSCAVFWDIENINVPKGQTADSIVKLIRSTIIEAKNLNEIYFYCVCDVQQLPSDVGNTLTELGVIIVQAYKAIKESADNQILDLMRKFVQNAGKESSIVLISGDGDYLETLINLKKSYNVLVYLIRLDESFSTKLEELADHPFVLKNGQLRPVKSVNRTSSFISITNYPQSRDIKLIMADFNGSTRTYGSIEESVILHENSILIGFSNLLSATKAVKVFNGSRYYGHYVTVDLIRSSLFNEIIRCIKPARVRYSRMESYLNRELSFIQILSSSFETASQENLVNFFEARTSPLGSQCVLSRKSSIWIVFSSITKARNALTNIIATGYKASISRPPDDLISPILDDPWTVKCCVQESQSNNSPRRL